MTTNKPRRTKENRPMNKYEGIDLPRVMHVMSAEIATLHGELYRWMTSEAYQPTYPQGDISMEHLRSAALQLSIHTIHHLEELIDWDHYNLGLFALRFCKYHLPQLLENSLTPEEWYQMASNYIVPDTLSDTLRGWVRTRPELKLKVIKEPNHDNQ